MASGRGHPQRGHPHLKQRGAPTPPAAEPAVPHAEGDAETVTTHGFVLPGGRVDDQAMHKALEAAAALGVEDDGELRRVVFTLNRDLCKRLDKYLTDRITFMSRTQLQRLIDEGGVLVNQRTPKASTVLRQHDVVEVVVPPPPSTEIKPENVPLSILYEDDAIIVINKSPDIIVHPARSNLSGTMINALAWHLQHSGEGKLSGVGKEFARPGVVHRLDRHTSGCIVFAKKDEAHWKLGHQFEHRRVDKRYLALAHGHIKPDVQVIELPIGPHPSREKGYREKYVVRHDDAGRHAVTIARVRERYTINAPSPKDGTASENTFTLVELELKTGRTHQIRVHLSYHDWPIAGDGMYNGKPISLPLDPRLPGPVILHHQALHACTLGIRHPITEEPMEFTAPLRGELATLVNALRLLSGDRLELVNAPGATIDLSRAVPAST